MGTGTVKFQLNGKQVTAFVSNAAGKPQMETLAHALHDAGLTHAAIPRVTYSETVDTNIPVNSPPSTADVGLFANVLFRRNSDGTLFGLLIHAPNMTMFDAVEGQGYRVKYGDGVAIADIYSDCAGEPFTFYEGWLQGSSLNGVLAP